MDTIERINAYNLKKAIIHEPVTVSKKSSNSVQILYVVVGEQEEVINNIIKNQRLDNTIYNILLNNNIITEKAQVDSVIYCGKLIEFTSYTQFVYKFPQRRIDIRERKEEQYRLYTSTLAHQKEYSSHLNICPTAKQSWGSVIKKVGKDYGLLLKIRINLIPKTDGDTL